MKVSLQKRKSCWSRLPIWSNIHEKRTLRLISILLVLSIINLSIGCKSYFKVSSSSEPFSETMTGLNMAEKSIIVHFNQKKWLLTDIQLKDNKLTGVLDDYQMPPTFNTVRPGKPNRYLTRANHNQRYLLNEVHLYLDEFADVGNRQVSIPVNSIRKIEIYDKDTASTVGSYFLGGLGIAAGAFLIVGVIAVLT